MDSRAYQALFLGGIPTRRVLAGLWERRGELAGARTLNLPAVATLVGSSLATKPMRTWEGLRHRRRAEPLAMPPVHVLGHWRSGTTFLHYLLSQDPQFAYVQNVHAMYPHHFHTLGRSTATAMPATRPMDDVRWALDSPQEEEIALAKMVPWSFFSALLSPHLAEEGFASTVLLDGLTTAQLRRWERAYSGLLGKVSAAQQGRRLLLKNPANTGRIRHLQRVTPGARFLAIHRHPYAVFASMRSFYASLHGLLGLAEAPSDDVTERLILTGYAQLMHRYLRDRAAVPPSRLVEVRYEALCDDPEAVVGSIYEGLDLGPRAQGEQAARTYLAQAGPYRRSHRTLSERERQLVHTHWGFAFDAFDYPRTTGGV